MRHLDFSEQKTKLFAIRAATEGDLDSVLLLEHESWPEAMRHPPTQMMERIRSTLPKIFVLEMEQQVVASICTQRIQDIEAISKTCLRQGF